MNTKLCRSIFVFMIVLVCSLLERIQYSFAEELTQNQFVQKIKRKRDKELESLINKYGLKSSKTNRRKKYSSDDRINKLINELPHGRKEHISTVLESLRKALIFKVNFKNYLFVYLYVRFQKAQLERSSSEKRLITN